MVTIIEAVFPEFSSTKCYYLEYWVDEDEELNLTGRGGSLLEPDLAAECSRISDSHFALELRDCVNDFIYKEYGSYLDARVLSKTLPAIPIHITALSIKILVGLHKIIHCLKDIPRNVIILSMVDCGFDNLSDDKLTPFLLEVLPRFAKLDISDEKLRKKCATKITTLWQAIKQDDTTLNLSNCLLYQLQSSQLTKIFSEIPKHISTLNLSDNKLWTKCASELAHAFETIPSHINTLIITRNKFGLRNQFDLVALLSSIPTHITTIDISDNNLFKNRNLKERDQLLHAINLTNKNRHIILTGNGESAYSRVLLPLLSACKQNLLNLDVVILILSNLLPIPVSSIKKKIELSLPIAIIKDCYMRHESIIPGFFRSQVLFFRCGNELVEELRRQAKNAPNDAATKTLDHFYLK